MGAPVRPHLLTVALLPLLAASPVAAQGSRLVFKAGTTGLGADVAIPMSPRTVFRAGIGFLPFDYHGTLNDTEYTIDPPGRFLTAQLDVSLAGPLRVMGGFLKRSDPIRMKADVKAGDQVGDATFAADGTLKGSLDSRGTAPFLGIGFGRVTAAGSGFFLDLAVAFTGEPTLELSGEGPITEEPDFDEELEKERARAQDDLSRYYRYWPILSVGFRLGVGR